MPRVISGGVSIAYQERGRGEPAVVLIHAPLGLGATLKEEGAGLSLLQLPVLQPYSAVDNTRLLASAHRGFQAILPQAAAGLLLVGSLCCSRDG